MLCPKCNSPRVRRSRRASVAEYFSGLLLLRPYRCRQCRHRFFSAEERLHRLRYANCPRCGNLQLERVSPRKVPVRWFKALTRAVHRHGYRCDSCRWRFFDVRSPAPQQTSAPPSGAETPVAGG